MKRVLTLGEGLGVIRTSEGLATAADLGVGVGGAELNVAIGLRRLGTEVTWLGRVGSDGLGRRVVRELRAEGVEVIASTEERPTGLLLKERDALGRTLVTYHRADSAGSRLTPADLDPVDWSRYGVLHITGITPALSTSASDTVHEAVRRAEAEGLTISFDVNHRSRLWSSEAAAPVYRELAARSDVLFAGLDEAALLVGDHGSDPWGTVQALADLGPQVVALKLGEHGALAQSGSQRARMGAVRVDVVDTVGAGDAFVAGYLSELIEGRSVEACLTTAVRAGAAVCRHIGDWEGAIRRDELEAEVVDTVVR
jgi:2-dehydro-3-deoxygluconokinase